MVYVYAIVSDDAEMADLIGVTGESLFAVPIDNGHVICGEISALPPVDTATLKAQDALVRTLHGRVPALLPMRFGMSAADPPAVVEKIRAIDGLAERLRLVRDCEQMTIRVLGSGSEATDQPVVAGTGTEYLAALAKRRRASPELSAIAAAPGDLARDVRVDSGSYPGVVGSVYHLIARGREADYRASIDRGAATLLRVRVIVTGPSPAYAFA